MKKVYLNHIIAFAAALVLSACQGSNPGNRESNPFKGTAQELREQAVPLSDRTPKTQSYVGELFQFDVNNGTGKKFVFNFSQGVNKSYTVNFRLLVDKVSYTAKLELPAELQGKVSWSQSGSAWVLSWTPSADIIPATKGSLSFDAKIVLVPTTNDPQASKILANKDLSTPVQFVVQRLEAEPKVIKVEGLNEKTIYKADRPIPLTLTVADPAAGQQREPYIRFAGPTGGLEIEQVKEKGQIPSVNSFHLGKSTSLGNGTWAVNYTFEPTAFLRDVERANIDLSTLPEVITVLSTVSVVSYGQSSPAISIAIKIENPSKAKSATQTATKLTPAQGAKI